LRRVGKGCKASWGVSHSDYLLEERSLGFPLAKLIHSETIELGRKVKGKSFAGNSVDHAKRAGAGSVSSSGKPSSSLGGNPWEGPSVGTTKKKERRGWSWFRGNSRGQRSSNWVFAMKRGPTKNRVAVCMGSGQIIRGGLGGEEKTDERTAATRQVRPKEEEVRLRPIIKKRKSKPRGIATSRPQTGRGRRVRVRRKGKDKSNCAVAPELVLFVNRGLPLGSRPFLKAGDRSPSPWGEGHKNEGGRREDTPNQG